MKWEKEAEQAVGRVPFFVRKRVRKKVEEEAGRQGAVLVTMAHVTACQQRFMTHQEDELKGFRVETCFGPGGCPNRIDNGPDPARQLENFLAGQDLKEFMQSRVKGPLKMHHEFRVSISDCPNACSRPQIVDIGLIGACVPRLAEEPCSGCEACLAACREGAISLKQDQPEPSIKAAACLACGFCARVCPTGAINEGQKGFRILLGGKLGRHPQLGRELDGIFSPEQTLDIVKRCVAHLKAHNQHGERFGALLNRTGFDFLDPHSLKKP